MRRKHILQTLIITIEDLELVVAFPPQLSLRREHRDKGAKGPKGAHRRDYKGYCPFRHLDTCVRSMGLRRPQRYAGVLSKSTGVSRNFELYVINHDDDGETRPEMQPRPSRRISLLLSLPQLPSLRLSSRSLICRTPFDSGDGCRRTQGRSQVLHLPCCWT